MLILAIDKSIGITEFIEDTIREKIDRKKIIKFKHIEFTYFLTFSILFILPLYYSCIIRTDFLLLSITPFVVLPRNLTEEEFLTYD